MTGGRGRRKSAGEGGAPDGAASLDHAFAAAVRHYEEGRLAAAEKSLRAIQRRQPDIPDVLHLLALIELRDGRTDDAIGRLETAVAGAPRSAELHNLLGGALRKAGRNADAVDAYRRAVALAPAMADAHYNLANALKELDRIEDAVASYRQAVALAPDFADAHYNLGLVLHRSGRTDEAVAALETATRLNPDDAEALLALANALADADRTDAALSACARAVALQPGFAQAHFNRGNLLKRRGLRDAAIESFRRALAIAPAMAEAHVNLGVALMDRGEAALAADHFRAAVDAQPNMASAFGNLGNAQTALDDHEAAVASYRRALEITPDDAKVLTSLGYTLQEMADFEAAIACHRRAVAANPDLADAHYNLGLALLLTGRLAEGWREFEWRWRIADSEEPPRAFPHAPWAGEPVAGKTVLVWGEQGVGDEILYVGMVPDLLDAGARVVLECEPRLVPLFARSFPGVARVAKRTPPATATQAPDIDYQTSAGGLGRWLRPDLASFPRRRSYLAADPARTAALRDKYMAGGDGKLVGVAWISKNKNVGRRKSMALADWRPLAEVPGVRFVDLQYGDTADEREAFARDTGHTILHDDAIDQLADMDAFAAQVAAMDVVVSISNTTVHMAGALGVPTWVMLNTVPLPVWMMAGETSPWYPSVRLYRQTRAGDWADVVTRVARDLRAFAGH